MKKMIDPESEEGKRIQSEIEEQVRKELGLTGPRSVGILDYDFDRYRATVISRCEEAGVIGVNVSRAEFREDQNALREKCREDKRAERFKAIVRRW